MRRAGLFLTFASLLALLCYGLWIEPNRLVLKQYSIEVQGLNVPIRALLIGDFQAQYPWWDRNRLDETIQQANRLNADIVFLVGDYAHDGIFIKALGLETQVIVPPQETIQAIRELKAPGGIYAVLGNHDWWWDGQAVQRLFAESDIQLLFDESLEVQVHNQSLTVVGLEDISSGRPIDLEKAFSNVAPTQPTIVLSHSPDVYAMLKDRYAFDLLLSGHTHGGQVKLPLLGRPIVPIQDKELAYGVISRPPHQIVVTGGLGMSILPIRFGVPPELTLLELVPE